MATPSERALAELLDALTRLSPNPQDAILTIRGGGAAGEQDPQRWRLTSHIPPSDADFRLLGADA